MKSAVKSTSRSGAVQRLTVFKAKRGAVVSAPSHPVVPLKERRLTFGTGGTTRRRRKIEQLHLAAKHQLFIDGKFVEPHSKKYFESINPATEQTLTEIADGNAQDVDMAPSRRRGAPTGASGAKCRGANAGNISSASRGSSRRTRRASWPCWRRWTAASRSRNRATLIFRWSPRIFSITPAGPTSWSTRFPAGKPRPARRRGQIIPWNFPLLMAAWKLAPALACGNTVRAQAGGDDVASPRCIWREIFQEAELPAGVVNIVTGAGETGSALVDHPDVDKIAFTGSTEVGKRIAQDRRRDEEEADARTRRQGGATSSSKTRRSIRRSKASSRGILFQSRPRLLRGLAFVRAGGRFFADVIDKLRDRMQPCAWAIRWTRTPTSARSIRELQLR